MADLSQVPTEDLVALKAGDLSKVSTNTLKFLKGGDKADLIPQGTAAPVKDESANLPFGLRDVGGAAETAATLVTGGVGQLVGNVAGFGKRIMGAPMNEAAQTAADVAHGLTYQPRTFQGQDNLQMLDASKLQGLGPVEGGMLNNAGQAMPSIAGRIAETKARSLMPQPEPAPMAGMGSAMTVDSRLRTERAAALPVPIQLTKGQATRTFEQQQFEREAAKNAQAGAPLRERFADQNEQILQNFDSWIDDKGAGSLRGTGQIVTEAVANKAKMAKAHVNMAYNKARELGETSAPVDIKPLADYVASHEPEAINAPIISSVSAKLKAIEKDGKASINDIEEVRKMVGALSGKDATNAHFGKELKTVIDDMTDGVGGHAYQMARALRTKYAREFEDIGVIDKMLRTKPGTTDRAVAYEDVFKHSILAGSLDDVKSVRKTLQSGGIEGMKAWRDLQGQTIQHIKDEITSNVATDMRGNKVVSAAKLDKLVTELERDGKLDFIFGGRGADQIREVNAIAKDVLTSPPGSVNTSNTASILIGLLDTAVSGTAGLPLPIGTGINLGVKKLRENAMRKRINDALQNQQ